MTDLPDASHRTMNDPRPDEVQLREAEEVDGDEDVMEIRLPIASSGEVRNVGDDALTTEELRGMAEQINAGRVAVFPEHGEGDMVESGWLSQFEKLGYWTEAELQEGAADDGEDLLMATARMPDPESLPAATGTYRQALAIIKEQAKRGTPISASIGWREDEDYPGGVDLMETSIVGVGADPRTATEGGVEAISRAAVDAGADPDTLVERVADIVSQRDGEGADPDDARPFGPPDDPNKWEDFDACVADVEDWDGIDNPEAYCGALKADAEQSSDPDDERATYEVGDESVDITPPEAMVNAARAGLDAKAEYDDLSDCGTGVGEERANQIINDEVGPEVIDEVAAYLTSHEEDVDGIDDPPTDWDEQTWTDGCGPVQYALWGGTATGTGLDWAQRKANEVAEARGEDLPYDRTTDMTDDDTPDDGGTETDSEQNAGDGETTERAPEDVTAEDLFTFMAMHLDGMDEEDLSEAVDAADASYIGECDPEALADLVSTATGAEYGDVVDAMDDLMVNEDGAYEDDEMDDEEDDEDDDRSADDGDDAADDGEERSADDPEDGETRDALAELDQQLDEYENVRDALRNGDLELSYAADEGGAEYADGEDATERETDSTDLRKQNLPEY